MRDAYRLFIQPIMPLTPDRCEYNQSEANEHSHNVMQYKVIVVPDPLVKIWMDSDLC